jgi:hypothetical protein
VLTSPSSPPLPPPRQTSSATRSLTPSTRSARRLPPSTSSTPSSARAAPSTASAPRVWRAGLPACLPSTPFHPLPVLASHPCHDRSFPPLVARPADLPSSLRSFSTWSSCSALLCSALARPCCRWKGKRVVLASSSCWSVDRVPFWFRSRASQRGDELGMCSMGRQARQLRVWGRRTSRDDCPDSNSIQRNDAALLCCSDRPSVRTTQSRCWTNLASCRLAVLPRPSSPPDCFLSRPAAHARAEGRPTRLDRAGL